MKMPEDRTRRYVGVWVWTAGCLPPTNTPVIGVGPDVWPERVVLYVGGTGQLKWLTRVDGDGGFAEVTPQPDFWRPRTDGDN